MLLARRLVEAGVRLVTVDLRWWDTHVQGFDSLRRGFLPRWDQAYRGPDRRPGRARPAGTTLVVAWGEFGRTPRVNNDAGRDHYPNVFSAALAGGTVQGGPRRRLVRRATARSPRTIPKTPARRAGDDLRPPRRRHRTRNTSTTAGRPIPVLPEGKPIEELF